MGPIAPHTLNSKQYVITSLLSHEKPILFIVGGLSPRVAQEIRLSVEELLKKDSSKEALSQALHALTITIALLPPTNPAYIMLYNEAFTIVKVSFSTHHHYTHHS
jgi:siroheme synthase (precorrin-2 oxidase/ferrochelatase)